MSAGSYTENYRHLSWQNWPSWYQASPGLFRSKSWNGVDDRLHKKSWNPYSVSGTVQLTAQGVVTCPGVQDYTSSWSAPLINIVSPVPDPNALLKAWSKMDGQIRRHSFNAAVSFGEGHKTVQMLLSITGRLCVAINSLSHGNVVYAAKVLGSSVKSARRISVKKSLANQWLELKYGWMPLYSDVYEAMKAFYALTNRSAQFEFRAKQRTPGSCNFTPTWVTAVRLRSSVYDDTVLVVFVDDGYTPSIAADIGLYDPASLAWELLPFSFVADWFLPIGTFLSARAAPWLSRSRYAVLERHVRKYVMSGYTPVSPFREVIPAYDSYDNSSYTRGALSSSTTGFANAVPLPSFKSPFSEWSGAVSKGITLLSLAVQRIR